MSRLAEVETGDSTSVSKLAKQKVNWDVAMNLAKNKFSLVGKSGRVRFPASTVIFAFFLLLGRTSLCAANVNEWNFYSDPAGKTLSQAINSSGSAVFESGGTGFLETDGFGKLLCTHNDIGTAGMWTNGAILAAGLSSPVSSGVQYLRYDFSYSLTSTNNDSGCVAGFAFYDGTGNKVAGVIFQYDVGAGDAPGYVITELTELTNSIGTVAVVAKIDIDAQTLSVWYNSSGDVSGFSESLPAANISVSLASFDSLRFQATGDIQPAGSSDAVAVNLLRTADSWADILSADPVAPDAKYLDEWTFERDIEGTSLSGTINSGTNNPPAKFGAGFGGTVFTTNRALLCTGNDNGTAGIWTNGAVLDAPIASSTSGVHYLRYDVAYDFRSTSNDSGTVLGVYFTDSVGDRAAGLVLGYNTGGLAGAVPTNRTLTTIPGATGLTNNGTLTAIAEVDMDTKTLKVWYGLNGSNPTNHAAPIFTTNVTLTAIDNLRFQATGDFRPAGSADYAAVDNIRHTASWSEIIQPLADLTALPQLQISVTDSQSGGMNLGETNLITVVISNSASAGPASAATSVLTHDGPASAFTIVSNNAPVALSAGASVTNTYTMIANERGTYQVSVSAISAETNSAPYTFTLSAGANLSFLPEVITEVSGGVYPGLYEPGETLNIAIIFTNDGAKAVSNIVNSLTVASAGFTVTAQTSQGYPVLSVGKATSTVYQVVIGEGVLDGTYFFNVTNNNGALIWTNQFSLNIFTRQPNTDWVKANNTNDLNVGTSWSNFIVPDSTDRAIFTTNIAAALTSRLGSDLAWRGIALISNTAPWTITGTNILTIGSAGIDLSQAQANLTIAAQLALGVTQTWNVVTSRTLTVSGIMDGAGDAPVIKAGAGTLVLSGANAYKGGTVVSNGTLSVGNDQALGTGMLTVHGATVGAVAATIMSNHVELAGNSRFDNAADLTLSGTVSGYGSLTKTGAGVLIFNGATSYGDIITNNGVIEANSAGALGTGAIVMNSGSVLQSAAAKFGLSSPGIGNSIVLAGNATIKTKTETSLDLINIDGPISGTGRLMIDGYQIVLRGNNTFSGGLLLSHNSYLRFYDINALGTGDISMDRNVILLPYVSGILQNNIALTHTLRLHLNNQSIECSGQITGAGKLQVFDAAGTFTLSGDNAAWSGGIANLRRAKLVVAHTNALGTGPILFEGDMPVIITSTVDLSAGNGIVNDMQFAEIADLNSGETIPVEFNLSESMKVTGQITDGLTSNTEGLRKTGAAGLTLTAVNTYSGPTRVTEGSLTVDGSLASPMITVAASATLSGTGSVQQVSMESGSRLELSRGAMRFGGSLTMGGNVITEMALSDSVSHAALIGNGASTATLKGTLHLDFTGNTTLTAGDTYILLDSWGALIDGGVTITETALPGNLAMDTSRLFVDGTISLVARPSVILTVAPNTLTLNAAEGGTAQKTVTVSNVGDLPLGFSISDNAIWSGADTNAILSAKSSGGTAIPLNDPAPANPYQNGADSGESDTISIGFPFPFYGTTYTNLYIDSNGAIIFSLSNRVGNISVATNLTGHLPLGNLPLIAPFRHVQLFIPDSSPVRYLRKTNPNRLVLVYSNVTLGVVTPGTNLQFQAELFADGQIKFSYYNIGGSQLGEVAVGMQGDAAHYVNVAAIPASGKAVLLNDPGSRWVTYSPATGTVPAHSAAVVAFTADGTAQAVGTSNSFTATFNWLNGGSGSVAVNASIIGAQAILSAPSSVLFYGAAGGRASSSMVLSNSGTAVLNFNITDAGSADAIYQGAVSISTNWTDISGTGTSLTMLNPHENPYINATNEGFSALQLIGFAFPFYGSIYTQFSAGVNGGLSLGTTNRMSAGLDFSTARTDVPQQFIAPYWGNLLFDGNAAIRYQGTTNELTVTWQDMNQPGVIPGADQTFQTVLYANGRIEFRYRKINGSRWPVTKWGIRSGATQNTSGQLLLPGDEIITTDVYGYARTNYVDGISGRMVSVTSSNYPVITYTPSQGTIPVGGTATVMLYGTAEGLTPGGSNAITNTARLDIDCEAGIYSVNASFVATNSVESIMAAGFDEDGDGATYDEELIAGTDPLSSGSVFAVSTASGRVLSWPAAPGRTYTVWYTLDLKDSFVRLEGATGISTNRFTDTAHAGEAVIYYKVTVE